MKIYRNNYRNRHNTGLAFIESTAWLSMFITMLLAIIYFFSLAQNEANEHGFKHIATSSSVLVVPVGINLQIPENAVIFDTDGCQVSGNNKLLIYKGSNDFSFTFSYYYPTDTASHYTKKCNFNVLRTKNSITVQKINETYPINVESVDYNVSIAKGTGLKWVVDNKNVNEEYLTEPTFVTVSTNLPSKEVSVVGYDSSYKIVDGIILKYR